ncbi:MAG: xanthine dehydrogenase molybdopterin binding subunit, partial [Planctomycetota bacterium]
PLSGELWVDFAGAPVAAGRLLSFDASEALELPGVVAVFSHRDVDGKNIFGPIFHDEVFLIDDEIAYLGQPVVVVAATSRTIARQAARMIKIECKAAEPILSVEDAIEAGTYLGPVRKIQRGEVEVGFDQSEHIIEGTFRNNGQEQFYLESQACQAIPNEIDQLKLISSTQNPTETQAVVAEVLGLHMHQVVCECKRMGGGFGGKETQSALAALMVSLVAGKTNRPARTVYRKDQDMLTTGKRHAYVSRYKIGYDAGGRIIAAKFDFFSNGGAFADLSTSVMERTMLHADNVYHLPNVAITGQVCRTNLPPNTAFRGFGGPQGVIVIENVMQEIAQTLHMDAIDVRKANLYRDGDTSRNTTPYGQVVKDHLLPEIFEELEQTSQYRDRMRVLEEFNASSQTLVKGMAMSGIKFGISFTSKFLNQGNALVNVYTDGSVQVSTGGTEMGQGLNTKIRQLVADEFGIGWRNVILMTTSTEKNNNTSPTAASAGTDLNGTAAVLACREIRDRLAKFAAKLFASRTSQSALPEASDIKFIDGKVMNNRVGGGDSIPFGELCDLARRDRVDLGQRSFYATPGVDFDRETGRGTPFFYYTTGAAVAEVTIDRFTGELVVDRVDLLMDVGQMINPGIDEGQVIGGFIQGMGWCTGEELVYDSSGKLLSTGPTTYKIPNITDVPPVFNTAYVNNPKHKVNVRFSKAVGEPPLMLGIAPWLAAKHAMSFIAPNSVASLRLPATCEENLMCITSLTRKQSVAADSPQRFQIS